MGRTPEDDSGPVKMRVPLYFPVESRDLAAFSSGTPQKDQKLVNALQETIGNQKWVLNRPGLFPYGSIGANALIDLAILEVSNTQTFVPVTNTVSATGAGNQAIPANSSHLKIRAWAAGASGGRGNPAIDVEGGGGGGGAGCEIDVVITAGDWGSNISYVNGAKGAGVSGVSSNGHDGGATTVTSLGLSFPNLNLNAGGGKAGKGTGVAGVGGTATGGDTNVSGIAGVDNFGGASATLGGVNGAGGDPGVSPGGGGDGVTVGTSFAGADGQILFIWT